MLDSTTSTAPTIGEVGSQKLFDHLRQQGYVNFAGEIQPKYDPNQYDFQLDVPEEFSAQETVDQINDVIRRYVFRDRIVKKARPRQRLTLNHDVLDSDEFIAFWNQIAQRTRYMVEFDTDRLVRRSVENLRLGPQVAPPRIRVHRADLEQTRAGIREGAARYSDQIESRETLIVPDVITMIQGETNLTRQTIARILIESGRAEDIRINPQAFITQATDTIRTVLRDEMQNGLKYEKRGSAWHVREFRGKSAGDLERFSERLYEVQNPDRTVYDYVEFDSGIESKFVRDLDTNERVKYYVKLPAWFTVDTPIGAYNPDWAIMMEDESAFYLVRETKSSLIDESRRISENDKIHAARAHFRAIDVNYDVSTSFRDVEESVRQMRSPV